MPRSARRSRADWSRWRGASSPEKRRFSWGVGSGPTLYRLFMCGIVGYVGDRPCRDLLIAGLEKLEYRGYDSAGVSVISDGEVDTVRAVGNLSNLRAAVEERASGADGSGSVARAAPPPTSGLGAARWPALRPRTG